MTIKNMLSLTSDRIVQDVFWFVLLGAIFALLRFHKWDKKPQAHSIEHRLPETPKESNPHKTKAA